MLCDIMIVSHKRDLIWLYYCLRLLLMNWKEPGSRIIVRLEDDCRETVQRWGLPVTYYYGKPWPDGYMYQMYQKMISDDYTHADMMVMVDSDLMLLAPAKLEDFLENGKPIIETLEWSQSDPFAERVWRAPVSRVMALDLDRDYMVRAPNIYWRETFGKTRARIVQATGRSFFDAVYSAVPFDPRNFVNHPMTFADFECLNLYAATFERERYVVRPQQANPSNPFRLFWSHGDWSIQLQAELDERLKNRPVQHEVPGG